MQSPSCVAQARFPPSGRQSSERTVRTAVHDSLSRHIAASPVGPTTAAPNATAEKRAAAAAAAQYQQASPRLSPPHSHPSPYSLSSGQDKRHRCTTRTRRSPRLPKEEADAREARSEGRGDYNGEQGRSAGGREGGGRAAPEAKTRCGNDNAPERVTRNGTTLGVSVQWVVLHISEILSCPSVAVSSRFLLTAHVLAADQAISC